MGVLTKGVRIRILDYSLMVQRRSRDGQSPLDLNRVAAEPLGYLMPTQDAMAA